MSPYNLLESVEPLLELTTVAGAQAWFFPLLVFAMSAVPTAPAT